MENIGYYNGKFDLIEKMTVPMNDRAMTSATEFTTLHIR